MIGAFFVFAASSQAAPSDIVFSEIMYNPSGSDSKKEWVEIYNSGAESIIIIEGSGNDSWRFNDGSNHTLTLMQGSLTIPTGGFAILASDGATFLAEHTGYVGTVIDTVMSLNNTSDTIKLSSDKGESFFGSVTYENSWGADGDGKTLEKISLSGANDISNWQISSAPEGSPGEASGAEEIPEEEESAEPAAEEEPTTPAPSAGANTELIGDATKIKISEVFPNPKGDEASQEFIELYNSGTQSMSINGWTLSDASKITVLENIILLPKEYRAFYRSTTGIALNNTNESIYLYNSNGELIDSLSYASTIEAYSYALDISSSEFSWSESITPGHKNIILLPNEPPEPIITIARNPIAPNELVTISAAESSDPDDDSLIYIWSLENNFEVNGVIFKHSFASLGKHIITLNLSDGRNNATATTAIDVLPAKDILSLRSQQNSAAKKIGTDEIYGVSPFSATNASIQITEIFPNPAGADDSEWIELYNPNDFEISLDKWIIDDQDGGSRPHTISDRTIGALSYLVLGKEETKLTLNNSSDEVRLFDKNEKLIDGVLYDDAQEDQSYSKSDEEFWFWTPNTTPNEPNTTNPVAAQNNFNETFSFPAPITNDYLPFTDIVDIDLPNIRELEIGTEVRVQGTVAVEPGVLGKTYFYITGSPGIQVYFSKKDWPSLAVGDVIGVIGSLSESMGEARLKITDKQDIVPLYESDPPEPIEAQTGEIGEMLEGALVRVAAQLVEKKGASWYVDDGSGEAKITFQPSTNIKKPNAKDADWISATGLVSETTSGYRILPRYQEDINIIEPPALDQGEVLGESISQDGIRRFQIPPNNTPSKMLTYLLITSSALIVLLASLLIKLRVETKKRLKDVDGDIKK